VLNKCKASDEKSTITLFPVHMIIFLMNKGAFLPRSDQKSGLLGFFVKKRNDVSKKDYSETSIKRTPSGPIPKVVRAA